MDKFEITYTTKEGYYKCEVLLFGDEKEVKSTIEEYFSKYEKLRCFDENGEQRYINCKDVIEYKVKTLKNR